MDRFSYLFYIPEFWNCIRQNIICKACSRRKNKRKKCKYYYYVDLVSNYDAVKRMRLAASVGCGELWIVAAKKIVERRDNLQLWRLVEWILPAIVSKLCSTYIDSETSNPIKWLMVNHNVRLRHIAECMYAAAIRGNFSIVDYLLTNFPHVCYDRHRLNSVLIKTVQKRYLDVTDRLLKITNTETVKESFFTPFYLEKVAKKYTHTASYAKRYTFKEVRKYAKKIKDPYICKRLQYNKKLVSSLLEKIRDDIGIDVSSKNEDSPLNQMIKPVSLYQLMKEKSRYEMRGNRLLSNILKTDDLYMVRGIIRCGFGHLIQQDLINVFGTLSLFHAAFERGCLKIAKWCILNNKMCNNVDLRNYLISSIELSKTKEEYCDFFKFLFTFSSGHVSFDIVHTDSGDKLAYIPYQKVNCSELVYYAAVNNQTHLVLWMCCSRQFDFERIPFIKVPEYILTYSVTTNVNVSHSLSYNMIQLLKELGFITD